MDIAQLVFIGIKGSVVALNRATGEQVWATHLKGYDFVNVVMDNGCLFATCSGEVFAVDPATGIGLWHNPLKGLGTGLATIATAGKSQDGFRVLAAEKRRRDEEAAAGAAAVG